MRNEREIRDKISDSMKALEEFAGKKDVTPEEFFIVARQATYMTALYWVLDENIPKAVTALAVPIAKRMSEAQAKAAENPTPITEDVKKPQKGNA